MNPYRLMFCRCIRVCALIILTLAQLLAATSAHAQVTHTVIAAQGDAAPVGGNYGSFINTLALNARGQVAFDVFLSGPSTAGVFVNDGRTTSPTALADATNFGFVFGPSLANNGSVTFDTDTGIFRNDGTRTVPLMQNGVTAPGGGNLSLSGTHVANSHGVIAYRAFVTGDVSTQGIFRNDDDHITEIARDNTGAPTGGTFIFFSVPAINDDGQVVFFAETTGGSADFAIYRGDGESISTIFAANQSAPGGDTFVDFSDPLINKRSQVLALGVLENGTGLFLGDGVNTRAIALSGQAAPEGGNYRDFSGSHILNDHNQVAFEARLIGASRSGVFRWDNAIITPIALAGKAAAGTTGTFDTFGDMKMGQDGTVAFIATLTVGVGGVDASNNIGIWVGTSQTDLRLVARTGENIGGRTLTRPLSLGQLEFNNRPIVWFGRFAGNTTAIVSSDPGN